MVITDRQRENMQKVKCAMLIFDIAIGALKRDKEINQLVTYIHKRN